MGQNQNNNVQKYSPIQSITKTRDNGINCEENFRLLIFISIKRETMSSLMTNGCRQCATARVEVDYNQGHKQS